MPKIGDSTLYVVEGWSYAGQHQIRRINGRSANEVTNRAYFQFGFNPKEDLYIKPV
jgi:hypothetical protein